MRAGRARSGGCSLSGARWGAVALGALAGLAAAMAAFLLFGLAGVVQSRGDTVALLFLQFLGLVIGGYIAGRLAPNHEVLNGGLAGLAMFLVTTAIALAADPGSANPIVVLFTGLIAATLGSSGGALASARRP